MPPPGFSKGINDALIPASTLAHLKAAAVLGFALTLTGLLLSRHPETSAQQFLHFSGIILLVLSALCAGMAIFPHAAVRKGGQVFWGDIITHGSAKNYVESLNGLDAAQVESEYAATNYHFSTVLAEKYRTIRWAVTMLMAGCLFSVVARFV